MKYKNNKREYILKMISLFIGIFLHSCSNSIIKGVQ